ncbi:PREDICTED: uncharacterized protein LOC108764300 [Trachymyrmex cornetzi]|uniref:uncharacterized protein LOC108764300 n=1 Tax=Trachymyrmex cornetzi TaxID=471704 RepID=UPI00084F71F5|nr:PREDICTED: uncharacterized protein LOC108764300 [Trachymyrmex cornetzi]
MDFQNVNPLNVKLNRFSGNLLPMTSDDSLFPVAWRIYSAVIWLIETIQTSAVVTGILIVPRNKALQDATVGLVVTIQVFFLLRQMHVHRDLVIQLIQKLNEILCSEDKMMKIIVRSTLKPVEIPLKFYCIVGTGSIFVWCCTSFTVILKKNYFLYEDYRLPIVLSKQPFSMKMFLLGNCIATIASVYMFIKKVALDVYMINLILLVTAQYRYIAVKLTTIFRENVPQNQSNESEKKSTVDSLAVLIKMKALCRHHNAVIQITLMLKELLSLNMSLMYLINVFLFCFLNVMLISASVEITDKAFHEKWYQFGPSLKHMFRMLIITNNLECKLSISERFSLSLPSFMTILNQSYSFALLFLKMK